MFGFSPRALLSKGAACALALLTQEVAALNEKNEFNPQPFYYASIMVLAGTVGVLFYRHCQSRQNVDDHYQALNEIAAQP